MLGRKKPAPEPLSLSSPASTSTNNPRQLQQSQKSAQSAGVESPSPSLAASSPDSARSPTSAGLSPSLRSKLGPRRPQTAKAGSQSIEPVDLEPFYQRRRPSQTAYGNLPLTSSSLSAATSPVDQQYPSAAAAPLTSERKTKGGFFHFAKPSRTSNNFPSHSQRPSGSWNQLDSRKAEGPSAASQGGQCRSDLPHAANDYSIEPSASDISLSSAVDRENNTAPNSPRKIKAKGFGLLTRTKSRNDKDSRHKDTQDPMPPLSNDHDPHGDAPLRTAPVTQERSFREMMDSQVRNRSASRTREPHREKENRGRGTPPPVRDNGGSNFLSGLRNSSNKAAGMFGKGFFGKANRPGGGHDRPPTVDDEHYELKVLNLPLVAQTRKTRISKRLENSRDKTEFWMPAFPWRAIDYLNYKGCEVEGLYRVPGSGPQIKRWQRRFDEEHDVNLFEVEDLYDINVVGSMLKAWLRELPDELFPKSAQERVAREGAGADKVPQVLIDELSNLSPFQYYLLFAITCHLSLLLAHSDKNKMDFRNLCICFQPCMKIDSYCFKFLVCDWRDCWKGCVNEPAYIEQEYILFDQPPPRGFVDSSQDRSRPADSRGTEPQSTESKTPEPSVSEIHDAESRATQDNVSQAQPHQNKPNEIPRRKVQDRKELALDGTGSRSQEPGFEHTSDRTMNKLAAVPVVKVGGHSSEGKAEVTSDESKDRLERNGAEKSEGLVRRGDWKKESRIGPVQKPNERKKSRQASPAASHGSDSSDPSYHSANDKPMGPIHQAFPPSDSKASLSSGDRTISTTLTIHSDREPPGRGGELRPLSPIKPLSPLGFQ